MYYVYYVVSCIIGLIAPLWLRLRAKRGKEDSLRRRERYGKASVPRMDAPLIWLHAASMGESQSVLPLINLLDEHHPELRILLTTGTVTSARHMADKLPNNAFHQYVPLDVPWMIKRFLKHWQPDMVAFVDSELWPNMTMMIGKRDKPFALLNGRISERSARRWEKARPLCEALLNQFTVIFAKSQKDAARFANLGAANAVSFGNMKFSSPPLPANPKDCGALLKAIAGRPVWVAASTHPGEEAIIAEIHERLREHYEGLLTIIVPRHAARGNEICAMLREHHIPLAQRSRHESITDAIELYVADTMGELGLFYRLASLVFIGGSLVPHGGQNPFEPARLDCAILYGPHMHNFEEFCYELESVQAAIAINDADDLYETLDLLLRNHDEQHRLAEAAHRVVNEKQQVISHIYEALLPYIEQVIVGYKANDFATKSG